MAPKIKTNRVAVNFGDILDLQVIVMDAKDSQGGWAIISTSIFVQEKGI